VSGISFSNGWTSVLVAGALLTVTSIVIKPIINILLLPLNLITFGLFRWVGYVVSLYLVTLVVPGFKLTNFVFSGYNSYLFSIPGISFSGILSLVIFSLLISAVSSVGYWIFK